MPMFDVHAFVSVRVKITGVVAGDHLAAIAVVEDDSSLFAEIGRRINFERPTDKIAAMAFAEETTAYLVDVTNAIDHDETLFFEYDAQTGQYLENDRLPGQGVDINRFHHAALGDYADGECQDALSKSNDLYALKRELNKIDDPLPTFIAGELAGLGDHQKIEAIGRIDQAIDDLSAARQAVADLPDLNRTVPTTVIVFHSDPDDIFIPIRVDGIYVGQLHRERYAGRLWRDCILEMKDGARVPGLAAATAYLRHKYGIQPEVTIQTHAGYYILYGADGLPFSRVLQTNETYRTRELAQTGGKEFGTLEDALAAARPPVRH